MEQITSDFRPSVKKKRQEDQNGKSNSILNQVCTEYFLKPPVWMALFYINSVLIYCLLILVILGHRLSPYFLGIYFIIIPILLQSKKSIQEKIRIEIGHRIPFFADALANALSVGATLEQGIIQASYYLKGEIKEQFEKLILKSRLGMDVGGMLRQIDQDYPNTGLRYLISLISQYRELGVGISPLLKQASVALTSKEEAEQKIRAILASGSSYSRLSIGVFALLFSGISYLLKDQAALLISPSLKPTFLFLCTWTFLGILLVSRMTSMDFARSFALRPQIKHYLAEKNLSVEAMMRYSGVVWTSAMKNIFYLLPALSGFFIAYLVSMYSGHPTAIGLGFIIGGALTFKGQLFILKGLLEDQLIKAMETFPDVLQVFIIGLNSGLNTYKAFEFAEQSVRGEAPLLLSEELCRTKFAMECGEDHTRTWQRFAEMLPFETVIDFCEIMVVAPMHGESIVNSIVQMTKSYETKKLLMIEKNAVWIGQIVIPLIVVAFFPLFLFSVFAPLIKKVMVLFN